MKRFMDEDFLLDTETAQRLYHEHAAKMPILDAHSHIHPREIAEDKRYRNLAEAWLADDHAKWRLMRANGVPEQTITVEELAESLMIKRVNGAMVKKI